MTLLQIARIPAACALLAWASTATWAQGLPAGSGLYAAAVTPPSGAVVEQRVTVQTYRVNGNTLVPSATIEAELAPLTGSRSLSELKQAAAAVQALYARAGYGAVVAFLPEQPLGTGTIAINVVEGKLTGVTVTGNRQFSTDNIRAGLPGLRTGATPRLTEIDTQIQLHNENPAKQVQVLLQPGQRSGEVEAKVEVSEQPVQTFTVAIDNTGTERTGEGRLNLGWQHANLWGQDHVLSAQFQTSIEKPQLVTVLSAGYRVPFYEQSLALDAYAAYSDVDGGTNATLAGDVTFAGKGRIVGLRLSRYLPRLGELDQRLSLGFEHRAYLNNCQVLGFAAGACGPAGESVAVQPVSLDYAIQRGGERPLGFSLSLVHNLALGGSHTGDASFDAVRPGAGARYTLARFSGLASAPVGEDWQVSARAFGQFTFNALVPAEQFGIGGVGSVRGYQEREVTGDRGSFGSVEFISPDLAKWVGLEGSNLRFIGFADAGVVENLLETPCAGGGSSCSQASVGVGLRLTHQRLQGRLFIAHALKASALTGKGDTRVHAAVSLSF